MGSEDEDEDEDGGALDWGASAAADAASLSPPPAPVVVAAAAPPGPPTSTSASTELLEPAGPSVCAEAAFQFVDEPLAGREFKGVSRAGALAAEYCESNPEVRTSFLFYFLNIEVFSHATT